MRRVFDAIILLYFVFIIGCSDDLVYNTKENTGFKMSSNTGAIVRESADIERGIFLGINDIRVKRGLSTLQRDPALDRVARDYSRTMAESGTISHVDAAGRHMEDRLEDYGIVDWTQAGENLASSTAGAEPVQSALWGWQRSPGHLENLLLPTFVYTGVGAYRNPTSGEVFITQLFMKP